jgi:hypothetical protein
MKIVNVVAHPDITTGAFLVQVIYERDGRQKYSATLADNLEVMKDPKWWADMDFQVNFCFNKDKAALDKSVTPN